MSAQGLEALLLGAIAPFNSVCARCADVERKRHIIAVAGLGLGFRDVG